MQIVIFDVTSFKIFAFEKVSNFVCPGGEVTCSAGQTCCRILSGVYGCCVFTNAVSVPMVCIAAEKDIHVQQQHAQAEQK